MLLLMLHPTMSLEPTFLINNADLMPNLQIYIDHSYDYFYVRIYGIHTENKRRKQSPVESPSQIASFQFFKGTIEQFHNEKLQYNLETA